MSQSDVQREYRAAAVSSTDYIRRCCGEWGCGVTAPVIEFIAVKSHREFSRIRSSNQTIRFRVWRRSERTEIDGDWFSTKWELSPSAVQWDLECRTHPCKRAACGGGKSCVILAVAPGREDAWSTFLDNLLARPESWLTWNGRRAGFVPLAPALEAAA